MALKAVIFDMDGVLCTTVEYHYQSWKRMADEAGIPFTREDNEKLRGLTRERSLTVLLGGRSLPEHKKQALMARKNAYYVALMEQIGPSDLFPGVTSLFGELKEAGLKIGVASGSQHARAVLHQLKIDDEVDAIADGNLVPRSKPAPDVFLQAARMLGVAPDACIAVEDAEAGVEAALNAGMCVVGIGPPQRVGRAHAVFPDLAAVHLADLRAVYRQCMGARGDASVS